MADALSDAKKLLAHANKTFPSSMAKAAGVSPASERMPKPPAPKMPAPAAPVTPGTHSGSVQDQNARVGQEEGAKYGMKGVPILHKGGKKKGEGLALLKDDETVRTPEQEQAVQEKLKGTKAEALMTKDEPKGKSESKSEGKKKKKHPFKRTVIDHHSDGSHTMTHEHESGDPKQNVTGAKPDLQGVHDGLEENVGEPVAPPQAAPGAAAVPGAPAGPALAAPPAAPAPAGM